MNIHDLKGAEGAKTASKRVGRGIGSGTGKTSTRGHKGQWARSGGGVRPNFEGGQMRFAHVYNIVNVEVFNRFEDGAVVGIDQLVAAGIIKVVEPYGLKVLGDGSIEKKVTVQAQKFTGSAIEKIEKAGGKAEVVE